MQEYYTSQEYMKWIIAESFSWQ